MLARALLAACICAYALALTPLSAAADDNDCALYLSGPGRTSSYDYNLNLLRGNFAYDGQHTCITYDAVNQAYQEARKRIVVAQPKGDWKPEDYASVGELVLDISINLARTYGLTYEEIEKGLPLIDTSRTLIREVCPPIFSHVECRAGKYRRMDGLCNNLEHPTWGATNAPFQRLIGPLFSDGINAPRISHTGRDLPLSRVVSRTMHPDDGYHDHAGTIMVIAWGQFMDHDYTLTGTPLDPVNRNDPEECCKRPLHLKHPYCNEIRVPDDDYFYRLWGVKCIDFVRAFPSPRPGCRLGSRIPYNTLTGAIDGNTIYGVTEKFSRKLRTGYGGLLRMNNVFKEYGLKDLLPLKLDIPDEGCTRPNKNMYCFEAGEIRVNEQLILTVMHTLMAREHNRIAEGLAAVNPHWDDETLFQESRRINIAEIQHITYNEFLPILLGKDVMQKFGLVLEKDGYWEGYDPTVNPDVIASFASAAYRFGHSLLPTAVERWSKAHKFIASKRLSDLIRRPYDLYRAGVLDEYVMGLMNQVAQAMDDSITQEVTNHLFKKVGARFGMDLVSFNMQRGREFGIPGYMEFRKFCGLAGANNFQELFGSMPNETLRKYETIFEHPIDVDLWSGGVSERPLPGSMLGPTFACIIATQFSYSRRGDRFWYELPNQPSSFTPEQLTEVRKARMARIICDNTDIIDSVQLYPMVLPDHELNPRVPCRSGIIPSIDFSKWAEPPPAFPSAAKQFITDAIAINNHVSDNNNKNNTINENNSNHTSINQGVLNTTVTPMSNECNDTTVLTNQINLNTENIAFIDNNNTTDNCTNNENVLTATPTSDTILKYVYKKSDKNVENNKLKGHFKNSLRRKRRSNDALNYSESSEDNKKNLPLIVNYETSHSSEKSDEIGGPTLSAYKTKSDTSKENSPANYNIETLHKPNSREQESTEDISRENDNKENYRRNGNYQSSGSESDELSDRLHKSPNREQESIEDQSKENLRNYRRRPESGEYSDRLTDRTNNNVRESEEDQSKEIVSKEDSRQSKEDIRLHKSPNRERESIEDQSKENLRNYRQKPESEEDSERIKHTKNNSLQESTEDQSKENVGNGGYPRRSESNEYTDRVTNASNNKKQGNGEGDSKENVNSNDYHRKNDYDSSRPESEEYLESSPKNKESNENMQEKIRKIVDDGTATIAPNIQEVDLGDFSYERIKLKDNGKVEAVEQDEPRDNSENKESKETSSENIKPEVGTDSGPEYIIIKPLSAPTLKEPYSKEENNNPININDGEVKPVVELTEGDISEENVDNIENLDDKNILLEAVKIDNKDIKEKDDRKQDNVKEQFERIPINYNHDKNKETPKIADNSKNNANDKENTGDDDRDLEHNKEETTYDENLNLKFGDIAVKLPEIQLPDDILSYNYEEPTYNYNNKNKKPRKYDHDDSDDDDDDDDEDDSSEKQRHGRIKEGRNNKKHNNDGYGDFGIDNENYYDNLYNSKYRDSKDKGRKPKDSEEEDDEGEDLYEKFVRERFGKRKYGSNKKLGNLRELPISDGLYKKVKKILKKTKQTEQEAEKSNDPKAGYAWTLNYGQQLV